MEKIPQLKTPEKVETEILTFQCNLADKEKLWLIADENDCSLSKVMCYIVKDFLERNNL